MNLTIVSSPVFAGHTPPPGHPESPERAEVMDVVAARWRALGARMVSPEPAGEEALARVHAPAYLERLAATAGHARMLDADTFTSPESWDLARLAAGAAVQATAAVLGGETSRAIALVRPPGHHALADRAMGFCLINNVAVAAADALARGAARVAIVDVDVHHGNGTQAIFESDPRVLYVSLHQWPFYPGTGSADEAGAGDAAGTTVNVPLPAGCGDAEYDLAMRAVVLPIVTRFEPGVVLVSAGFDASARDPLARMRVSAHGFDRIARQLAAVADAACGGRLALVTEGGYDLPALASLLHVTLAAVTGGPSAAEDEAAATDRDTAGAARAAIDRVRAIQARWWRGL